MLKCAPFFAQRMATTSAGLTKAKLYRMRQKVGRVQACRRDSLKWCCSTGARSSSLG